MPDPYWVSEANDQTHIFMDTRQVCNLLSHNGNSKNSKYFYLLFKIVFSSLYHMHTLHIHTYTSHAHHTHFPCEQCGVRQAMGSRVLECCHLSQPLYIINNTNNLRISDHRVPWWLRRLRIQNCHCCGSGYCFREGLIPCLGILQLLDVAKKKKKKNSRSVFSTVWSFVDLKKTYLSYFFGNIRENNVI